MSNVRATSWSLTLNNPTSADEECINLARQNGWKVEGQLEKGKKGTPHYQIYLQTPQVRVAAVKKMFPRAHIEVARNAAALKAYVHKEETREGELPTSQEMYPSLSRLWELVYDDLLEQGDIKIVRLYSGAPHPEITDRWDILDLFDWSIGRLIRKGYHVESMASNPQNRTAFKKYAPDLMVRVHNSLHRQTDRQTDTAEEIPEVTLPMYHTPDALCSPSSPQSPSSCSQDVSSSSSLHSQGDAPHP